MTVAAGLLQWWRTTPTTELIWVGIGLTAQLMFSMRFLVQWIATEKARASTMPTREVQEKSSMMPSRVQKPGIRTEEMMIRM